MEASSEKKEPTAAEIMTADAVTVHENAKVHEVAQLMSEHNISGVPVVNDNHQVVGIVTEGDMVEMDADIHFPHYINFLDSVIFLESTRKFDKRVRHVFASSVCDIMTTEVETVQKLKASEFETLRRAPLSMSPTQSTRPQLRLCEKVAMVP